ncbi:RNA polymerase sigma factor [Brevibacillus reuszeri]|uniref:RNA polymerase n=1 Tax=Brevibacillus reuszeri TaxID=54915 RepID=A0A0K9YM29_9BACL|nr:sigma-70 family RNA polymerase sigma factor [Brevibacillus reuszeri]KNB69726.1 RNA polymerase [Brevibacillus reuszeri]MED1858067.1 sigma-70 family RNA polymerase sigma factor [Brevibacillus reuszeri]GED68941.1 RNA polymerase sigma factor [Brevibacillus reuszeri]
MKGCGGVGKVSLDDVYKLHVNDIYRYLFRLTRDARQAEDLTQETFFRAFLSLDDYHGEKVRPWLFKVAYHAFVDWHRKQVKRPVQLVEQLPDRADPLVEDPAETVVNKEMWGLAQELLRQLSEKQKQVILLAAIPFSYAEIAEILGIDVADVKRSLFRGRQKMRKLWRDGADGEER